MAAAAATTGPGWKPLAAPLATVGGASAEGSVGTEAAVPLGAALVVELEMYQEAGGANEDD